MVKGILADANNVGQIEYLVQRMQAESWAAFWSDLGLELRRFEDVGLAANASDLEIWQRCQEQQLILVTDNRNADEPNSLEAVIRSHNRPESLPVFTIARLNRLLGDRLYAERVVVAFYEYLQRIDTLRGTGRLYLP